MTTTQTKQTVVNISKFDEMYAAEQAAYERAKQIFNGKFGKLETLTGDERTEYMIKMLPDRERAAKLLKIHEGIEVKYLTIKAAAQQGDAETVKETGDKLEEDIKSFAELDPSFQEDLSKLKENDPYQDKRIQHIEDYLETLDEYFPGVPTFTPYREGEAAAPAATPTPTVPTQTAAIPVNPNPVTTGFTPTQMVESVQFKHKPGGWFSNLLDRTREGRRYPRDDQYSSGQLA